MTHTAPIPATPNTTQHLTITVYGTPAPQGSKRHVGRGIMVESSKQLPTWREDVKHAALTALNDTPGWTRDHTHIAAHITFTLPRPRSHYRTGRNAHLLRDNAPTLHGVKPDLDKLIRSTGDALGAAGVWSDDSRLAQVVALKVYPSTNPGGLDRPGAHIVLTGVRP